MVRKDMVPFRKGSCTSQSGSNKASAIPKVPEKEHFEAKVVNFTVDAT